MRNLPPHNQLRLNKAIRETYGDRYADWYDLATQMQAEGATYEDIRERFAVLGVPVSPFTVYYWLRNRQSVHSTVSIPTDKASVNS